VLNQHYRLRWVNFRSAVTVDVDICDSEWLVLDTEGVATHAEALEFGHKLRDALEMSSVATRLCVDAGKNLITAGLAEDFRHHLEQQIGPYARDNVHGLDVFIDDPNVRFMDLQATFTVRATRSVSFWLRCISWNRNKRTTAHQDVILLLNTALMQPHPVAQLVFAVSAVETLGQQEWTAVQKQLLLLLAETAESSDSVGVDERSEIAHMIRRRHRVGIRQGVMRLLDDLDLTHLKSVWDEIYSERSTLVHGLAPQPGADYSDLTYRAMSLCGRILLKAVAKDIPAADGYVDKCYVL
ncbi:MAG: hypothetical protein ABI612_04830, partial [Betaproteobacteria bacterium]